MIQAGGEPYSNNGRSAKRRDAASIKVDNTLTLGKVNYTNLIKYDERQNGYGQHGQGQKLAEHTLMQRGSLLAQMTVAVMLYTLITLINQGIGISVNMNRRQNNHWHKHCQ